MTNETLKHLNALAAQITTLGQHYEALADLKAMTPEELAYDPLATVDTLIQVLRAARPAALALVIDALEDDAREHLAELRFEFEAL